MRFGKTAQTAVSVISLLAERKSGPETPLSSLDIAQARSLRLPLVAKVLTVLSGGGLIAGTRGPGGGYWLARPPAEVSLYDITRLFEKPEEVPLCPFGPGWCGNNDPCPVHDAFVKYDSEWVAFLKTTTLGAFVDRSPARARAAAAATARAPTSPKLAGARRRRGS
jgi:Rrf2 family protein